MQEASITSNQICSTEIGRAIRRSAASEGAAERGGYGGGDCRGRGCMVAAAGGRLQGRALRRALGSVEP